MGRILMDEPLRPGEGILHHPCLLYTSTMRVKMIVAYDGTNYKGWQVQPNGITIEEVLNKNLSNLLTTAAKPSEKIQACVYCAGITFAPV